MKNRLYIFSNTLLKRKDNTLFYQSIMDDEENYEHQTIISEDYLNGSDELVPNNSGSYIPIESIDSIFSFGTLHFNSRFLSFLAYNGVPLHNFSFKGDYIGSFFPPTDLFSGSILIKQSKAYLDDEVRLAFAQEIISASIFNMSDVLKYYNRRNKPVADFIEYLAELREQTTLTESVEELRGVEGNARKIYYSAWQYLFSYPIEFSQRIKRPPNNLINALISYGNMIVYSICLNQIYQTKLNHDIGFVHEPGDGKYALAYDIADIFKPLITDRAIFYSINKNIISEADAFIKNGNCILTKDCRKKFVGIIEDKLQSKLSLPDKDKSFTLVRIIKEECYKIIKAISDDLPYKAYKTNVK